MSPPGLRIRKRSWNTSAASRASPAATAFRPRLPSGEIEASSSCRTTPLWVKGMRVAAEASGFARWAAAERRLASSAPRNASDGSGLADVPTCVLTDRGSFRSSCGRTAAQRAAGSVSLASVETWNTEDRVSSGADRPSMAS